MNLTMGQKVLVYWWTGRGRDPEPAEVINVGRKLVTLRWGGHAVKFRMDTGHDNGYGNSWFKTYEQAESDDRRDEAVTALRGAGVDITNRSKLTCPQIEELAATVKRMLSEKTGEP